MDFRARPGRRGGPAGRGVAVGAPSPGGEREGPARSVGGRGVTPCPVSHQRPAGAPSTSVAPHPPTAARRAPPSPHGRGGEMTYARRIASKVSGFQRPELSRPDLIPTVPGARILVSPRRRERAHGQRPMRRRGAIERDWAGGGYSSVSGEPGVAGPARRRRRRG